jgi:hypothetical protein
LSRLKLETISLSNGVMRMQFQAMSNKTYSVQYNGSLDSTNWQSLTGLVARKTNHVEAVVDLNAIPNRFYRVVTPRVP